MPTVELAKGIVSLEKETDLPAGLTIWLESTSNPRKFFISVRKRDRPTGKVRHYRPVRETLTGDLPQE